MIWPVSLAYFFVWHLVMISCASFIMSTISIWLCVDPLICGFGGDWHTIHYVG